MVNHPLGILCPTLPFGQGPDPLPLLYFIKNFPNPAVVHRFMGSGINKFLESWHAYFLANESNPGNIPWGSEGPLSAEERRRISASVVAFAAFQLGEYSEGKGLLKLAEEYAARAGAKGLTDIPRLFIREEQHHALLLKRFMDAQGIESFSTVFDVYLVKHLCVMLAANQSPRRFDLTEPPLAS